MNRDFGLLTYMLALLLVWTLLGGCTTPPTLTPAAAEGKPSLFADDFTSPNRAWALFETNEGAAYVQQGELYLEDRGRGIGIYTHPVDHEWQDVEVDVRVRHIAGAQNNWMGVICRQQDEENYYLFAISADGYYLILKVEAGIPTPVAGPLTSELINAGRATNQLLVRCEEDTLALSINGDLVALRTDRTFREGNVALFADAVEAGSTTTVAFDALTILEP
ncbi:MAG: hypothetical protein ACLFU8_05625 [Anaerolineales bacterium]